MPEVGKLGEKSFKGIPVSAGVRRGKVFVLNRQAEQTVPKYPITEGEIPEQLERFEHALVRTRHQLQDVQRRVQKEMGSQDADIFDAHLLVLDDPILHEEVQRIMSQDRVNVDYAFSQATAKYLATFEAIEDDFFRERMADVRDVTARILHNLIGGTEPQSNLDEIKEPCILVAFDLAPSQTALLDRQMVLGFATDQGSLTSHTAILARSLELPAVTGLGDITKRVKTGQYALLDGLNGMLVVNPTDQTLFEYGELERKHLALHDRLLELREQPAITLDNVAITVSANIDSPNETPDVQAHGAEGVGLFRTEYLFLGRESLPTEDEQFEAYSQAAAGVKPASLVIRSLDIGGDKFISSRQAPTERNPFLGWRAIRICLQEKDLFKAQLRAVLRASVAGNIKLMYPMISGVEELEQANLILAECKAELAADSVPFDDNLEVGVMIEIPAAAMVASSLAKRVKFFSIGTNDLIQYTLAVDRMNPKIAHLYEPTHPAVLRLIKLTADAAKAADISVCVCGEMAGDPVLVPLLLGLGVEELSTAAAVVPAIKFIVRQLKMSEARELATFALACDSGTEVLARAREFARRIAPSLFPTQEA